jgi:hypothetical protein
MRINTDLGNHPYVSVAMVWAGPLASRITRLARREVDLARRPPFVSSPRASGIDNQGAYYGGGLDVEASYSWEYTAPNINPSR